MKNDKDANAPAANCRNKRQKGVTTVEYAIMLALVALAVAAASPNIKSAVVSTFNQVATTITALN